MLRTVLAIVVLAHGVGHVLFLLPLLGLTDASNWGQSTTSWLLTGPALARLVGSAVWIVALVAFCAAAYGLFSQLAWWRTAAILGAIVSAAGLILFWSNPPTSPALAALVFDLVVLGALAVVHWPTPDLVGA